MEAHWLAHRTGHFFANKALVDRMETLVLWRCDMRTGHLELLQDRIQDTASQAHELRLRRSLALFIRTNSRSPCAGVLHRASGNAQQAHDGRPQPER